jgi:hypothetical protein
MSLSVPIQVDGTVVGAAIPQEKGVRFIATDVRAGEMDQTVWNTTAEVQDAAEQLVRTGKIRNFSPDALED